ncbi:methyltransferase domain-containing protein [Candidatus Saccharibacteria bacterium]|nr:methyltransferase domain-containing protein [Candidatus Saccharibacteria bacterium]
MEVPCQKETYYFALNNLVKSNSKVLDVGFGQGYGMSILSVLAKEVYGVEVDEKALDFSRRTLLGKNPKIRGLYLYDGYHLPFQREFFDVATCVDVIEHVEDYDRFIDELLRVSRCVLFSTPNRRPEYTNPDGTPKNRWHLREWSYEELDVILRRHNAKLEWYFIDGPWDGPFKVVDKLSRKTLVLMPILFKRK